MPATTKVTLTIEPFDLQILKEALQVYLAACRRKLGYDDSLCKVEITPFDGDYSVGMRAALRLLGDLGLK
jgi:hypothetical protein